MNAPALKNYFIPSSLTNALQRHNKSIDTEEVKKQAKFDEKCRQYHSQPNSPLSTKVKTVFQENLGSKTY